MNLEEAGSSPVAHPVDGAVPRGGAIGAERGTIPPRTRPGGPPRSNPPRGTAREHASVAKRQGSGFLIRQAGVRIPLGALADRWRKDDVGTKTHPRGLRVRGQAESHPTFNRRIGGSNPPGPTRRSITHGRRAAVDPPGWGPGTRRFESGRPYRQFAYHLHGCRAVVDPPGLEPGTRWFESNRPYRREARGLVAEWFSERLLTAIPGFDSPLARDLAGGELGRIVARV